MVDTETTGTSPTHNQIIEIAIIRIEGGVVVDTYQTLIRPERGVPEFITSVTGIGQGDLEHAPSFDEVALTIKEKLEGAVFVAHNARFDYSFIKNEFRRLDIPFQAKTVCTVKLSRLLYPQERHHNLDSIIDRFGLNCDARHRAYDDALVLLKFVQVAEQRLTSAVVEKALRDCLGTYTLPATLSKSLVTKLPNRPGVYIFYGSEREVLYVGKSINIKARVQSHFSGDHQTAKELALCAQVCDIEARVTTGELSALFLESKLIKELTPVYNRMLRKVRKLAVLQERITPEGYKTVSVEHKDGIEQTELAGVLGIFRTARQAKEFLTEAAHAHELCPKICGLETSKAACFQYQLEHCRGACLKREDALAYNLRFDTAFAERRLRAWPYKGPVVIKEEQEEFEGTAYVIDSWCVYKIITYFDDYQEESEMEDVEFDYDSYKILARHMLKPGVRRAIVPYRG